MHIPKSFIESFHDTLISADITIKELSALAILLTMEIHRKRYGKSGQIKAAAKALNISRRTIQNWKFTKEWKSIEKLLQSI